jgi:hypothetical protein
MLSLHVAAGRRRLKLTRPSDVDPANPWRRQRHRRTLSLSGVLLVAGGFMVAMVGIYFALEDIVAPLIR